MSGWKISRFFTLWYLPNWVIVDTIETLESRLLEGTFSLSPKYFRAAPMASSEPGKVGMILSNFCRKEAIAVKRPRTEGCNTMSGCIKTARSSGWGYEA